MITVPTTDDVSLDTFRNFFKAYISHKQFVNYMINLNATNLVDKNWVIQTKANETYKKLLQLQDTLDFNVKKLFLLVRQAYKLICIK